MAEEKKPQFLVGILLFDEVEVLDFCGPFEVFSITGYLFEGTFKVVTLAQKEVITARNGLQVIPTHVIGKNVPALDVLLVPGGYGTITEVKNESLLDWMKSIEPTVKNMLSVCTGVSLLGKCGFIDGMIVTTHRGCFELVQPDCPKSKLCKCQRFTDNGKFLTSAGISAGIDLAFYFVKKMLGAETAIKVGDFMEYDWKDLDVGKCTCEF